MEGDGEMSADPQPVIDKARRQVCVELGQPSVANIFDKAVLQTLQDANDENDGSLEMLENPIFDKTQPINRLAIKQSIILRVMYLKS